MGLFSSILGNVSEVSAPEAQEELQPILVEGEQVLRAYHLFRDRLILTDRRLITIDKEIVGVKRKVLSIPYASIKKFSKESAGIFDLDAELQVWITGEEKPMQWEFSKGANINEVYQLLGKLVLGAH
jgi:hypothetical protein